MSETKEQILKIRDLDITFQTTAGSVHAIRGVNIDLMKGETVAIVGESGSGKSVTMKAAMGILASNAKVTGGTRRNWYKSESGNERAGNRDPRCRSRERRCRNRGCGSSSNRSKDPRCRNRGTCNRNNGR